MKTTLSGVQKYLLFRWLDNGSSEDRWKRSAAELAEDATEGLWFPVSRAVMAYARRIAVAKPTPKPDPTLADRLAAVEAAMEQITALATRLGQLEASFRDHQALSLFQESPAALGEAEDGQ